MIMVNLLSKKSRAEHWFQWYTGYTEISRLPIKITRVCVSAHVCCLSVFSTRLEGGDWNHWNQPTNQRT